MARQARMIIPGDSHHEVILIPCQGRGFDCGALRMKRIAKVTRTMVAWVTAFTIVLPTIAFAQDIKGGAEFSSLIRSNLFGTPDSPHICREAAPSTGERCRNVAVTKLAFSKPTEADRRFSCIFGREIIDISLQIKVDGWKDSVRSMVFLKTKHGWVDQDFTTQNEFCQ